MRLWGLGGGVRVAKYRVDDSFSSQRLVRRLYEKLEDREFSGSKRFCLIADVGLSGDEIDTERFDLILTGAVLGRSRTAVTARMRAVQFICPERFGEVIIGAEVEHALYPPRGSGH